MIKKLVTNVCAKCGEKVDYFIVLDESKNLDLASYNNFKKPIINICSNCGYINDDLSVDNELYQNIKVKFNDNENDISSNLINNIKLGRTYLKSLIEPDKKIRVLAYIYENNRLLLNSFLRENYTKTDIETKNVILELKNNIKNNCEEILNLIKEYNFNDNLVNILKIEVLCATNKTNEAKNILENIKDLSPDLFDYLDEQLILGGKE